MKLIIPGGSGQVGTMLARDFQKEGHEVVVLSRHPGNNTPWRMVEWDGSTLESWAEEMEGADVVINLAGRNVNCRYTEKNKQAIYSSRVDSTKLVAQAIAQANTPPRIWLQAGTATIYAHRYDAPNDEFTGIIGGNEENAPDKWRFSIDVAKAWEKEVDKARVPNTRKLKLRSAMIMSPDHGGIFDTLLKLVRLGLGGRAASGQQYVSWIHERDFIEAVKWLIQKEKMDGVVNLSSPNPIPYADFMKTLRKVWGMPIGLPATRWMLELGTFFLRTETELVLKSRRVIPTRLEDSGFVFRFPKWKEAAKDLCQRWPIK